MRPRIADYRGTGPAMSFNGMICLEMIDLFSNKTLLSEMDL